MPGAARRRPASTRPRWSASGSTSPPARCSRRRADGTPLCALADLRREPHAWVKLWKHHAAQPEADLRQRGRRGSAASRGSTRYGGKISSEWFFAKSLQILREAPGDLRARRPPDRGGRLGRLAAHRRRDAQRLHRRLQGDVVEAATASRATTTSPRSTLASSTSSTRRCRARSPRSATRAGGLCERAAAWTGLRAGTAVAVANVDAHVSVPAATATEPGTMVMIMGTSICHILLGRRAGDRRGDVRRGRGRRRPGAATASRPGSRRSATSSPGSSSTASRRRSTSRRGAAAWACTPMLEQEAARLAPGESGLLALDWWNGNRSVLVDAELGGLLVGMTLATRAGRDLPRADRGDGLRDARDHRRVRVGRRRRRHASSPAVGCPSATSC